MASAARLLVIGLDCAEPRFIFGPDAFDLPNLRALMERGCWGRLRSCDPPITVPAWASMLSSKDPGTLGFYGFRNRKDYSYGALFTANSTAVKAKRVWDILSRQGKKVIVAGVPQTYPVKPVNGWLTAGFLAPDTNADFTYPKELKAELFEAVGDYVLDVRDFRTDDKERLLRDIHAFMHNRFDIVRHLMTTKPWDFCMMVEMAMDRIHHGFWKFCDPDHPKYEPGNRWAHVFREFYEAVDRRIGELLELTGEDTAVMVVSDHGGKAMHGGFCINQWLINEGLLTLKEPPQPRQRIEDSPIDWARTKVWSSGGYYARVFLNVEGREPEGIIPGAQYEAFRDELAARIAALPDPDGQPMNNRVLKPEETYREVNGVAPDLIVYFGDLHWRSVGTVGFDSVYTFENDTGPDDANHDYEGIFIMEDGETRGGRELTGLQLMDVAPTILNRLGVEIPGDMQGNVITGGTDHSPFEGGGP
ncbi:MAG: alkaline phosphatase family protein [Candidatus Hydrogenedentota bacterium]